jgi:hypothetical protein
LLAWFHHLHRLHAPAAAAAAAASAAAAVAWVNLHTGSASCDVPPAESSLATATAAVASERAKKPLTQGWRKAGGREGQAERRNQTTPPVLNLPYSCAKNEGHNSDVRKRTEDA